MATRFAQQFTRHGAQSLVRQFGEPIVYYADNTGGGRSINAIVERDIDVIGESGEVIGQMIVVRVLNNSTTGISSTEIDTGADQISVALRVGESAVRKQIVKVQSTENGMVRFEVN